jgi:hypothetical protein
MIEIIIANTEKDFFDWDEYVKTKEYAGFNASTGFLRFLNEVFTKGVTPYYIIARENKQIVGVLPSMLIKGKYGPVLNSMPWFGSNPGVIADNFEVEAQLIESFMNIARWTECLSATIISRPFQNIIIYQAFDWTHFAVRIGSITELPEYVDDEQFYADLMKKLHIKTRNQLRKSINGCEAVANDSILMSSFNFLSKTHRENMEAIGAPVKCREFWALYEKFTFNVDYDLLVAYEREDYDKSAALLTKYFNKTVDYMTPAILKEKRSLNPLHTLIYHAMKEAAKRGFKYWNWGGTMPTGMEGVMRFKKRFGSDQGEYIYFTKMFRAMPAEATKETLLAEYPYFYVFPFDELETK